MRQARPEMRSEGVGGGKFGVRLTRRDCFDPPRVFISQRRSLDHPQGAIDTLPTLIGSKMYSAGRASSIHIFVGFEELQPHLQVQIALPFYCVPYSGDKIRRPSTSSRLSDDDGEEADKPDQA